MRAGILNLTKQWPTPEQASAGLLPPLEGAAELMTFDEPPTAALLRDRAAGLAFLAAKAAANTRTVEVLIVGLPALMGPLELALKDVGLRAVYAHRVHVCVEETRPDDGAVRRVNVFKHVAFYEGAL